MQQQNARRCWVTLHHSTDVTPFTRTRLLAMAVRLLSAMY